MRYLAFIQINTGQGKHLTAGEYLNGKLIQPPQVYYPGDTMGVSEAEAVQLRKDTVRFTDKGH